MTPADVPSDLLGLYKWIIGTLAGVITILAGANAWQWREGNKVAEARLKERDTANKQLADANATLKALEETSKKRNEITDRIGDLIGQVSVALKLLSERLELQHDHTNKDLEKAVEAVEVMAESLRVVSAAVSQGFIEVKAELKARK